jgi:hypothetical protein
LLDISARARGRGGIGMQLEMHQRALPAIGLPRRDGSTKTLAPVGPQGPPARRAARLVAVATQARGSLLWTTGTSCASPRRSHSFNKQTACHSRAPSRQSSGTQHLRRGRRRPRPSRRRALGTPPLGVSTNRVVAALITEGA